MGQLTAQGRQVVAIDLHHHLIHQPPPHPAAPVGQIVAVGKLLGIGRHRNPHRWAGAVHGGAQPLQQGRDLLGPPGDPGRLPGSGAWVAAASLGGPPGRQGGRVVAEAHRIAQVVVELDRLQRQLGAGIHHQVFEQLLHLGQDRIEPLPVQPRALLPEAGAAGIAQQQVVAARQPGGTGRGHQAKFKPAHPLQTGPAEGRQQGGGGAGSMDGASAGLDRGVRRRCGGGQQRVGGNGEAIAGWRRGPGHHAGGVERQSRPAEAVVAQEGQGPLRLGRVVHHGAIDRGEPHAERRLRGGRAGGGQPAG